MRVKSPAPSMPDHTDTQTAFDVPVPESKAVLGVVVVFVDGTAQLTPHAVQGRCRVGRDETMEIPLLDSKVSRCHAELMPAPQAVLVTDMGSRNGTFINAEPVEISQATAGAGSVIRVGRSLMKVFADIEPFVVPSLASTYEGLVGGPGLEQVRRSILAAATSNNPLLIEGETGSGKEVVADAVHSASGRTGSLITVNCAALPHQLIESELFGHARGAFSGSERARRGLFRSADGGTLFLDEVGELPLEAQAKLLRVLESGEVRAVGEDSSGKVDVRVVAATNRSLDEMVQAEQFRTDLFHRIATMRVRLPPLRYRLEDVPLLCAHLLPSANISVRAMQSLLLWSWPGNVRELNNVIQGAAAHASARGAAEIDLIDLEIQEQPAAARPGGAQDQLRRELENALVAARGNVSEVARSLGMRRPAVYEKLRLFGLEPARFRRGS